MKLWPVMRSLSWLTTSLTGARDSISEKVIAHYGADIVRWWALATDWRTDVRVGGYDVDSSEFLGGRSSYGRMGGFPRMLVTEDDEMAIRHDVWLATDEAYKAAAAVAFSVLMKASAAVPPASSAEPALKPNQPTHSSDAPIMVMVRLCGVIDSLP